jgi:hypothetical protein
VFWKYINQEQYTKALGIAILDGGGRGVKKCLPHRVNTYPRHYSDVAIWYELMCPLFAWRFCWDWSLPVESLWAYTTHPPHILHTSTTHTPHIHHTYTTHPPHIHHTSTTHPPHIHHTYTTHPPHIHHTSTTSHTKDVLWRRLTLRGTLWGGVGEIPRLLCWIEKVGAWAATQRALINSWQVLTSLTVSVVCVFITFVSCSIAVGDIRTAALRFKTANSATHKKYQITVAKNVMFYLMHRNGIALRKVLRFRPFVLLLKGSVSWRRVPSRATESGIQSHFVHHKPHTDWPVIEDGPTWWGTGDSRLSHGIA